MFQAQDIMRMPVIKVSPDTEIEAAVDLLLKHDLSGLPVVDEEGRLLGMFSVVDKVAHLRQDPSGRAVSELMTCDVAAVEMAEPLLEVAKKFRKLAVHRLPVLEHGRVVGIIGCRDLVRFVRELETSLEELTPLLLETPSPCEPQAACHSD